MYVGAEETRRRGSGLLRKECARDAEVTTKDSEKPLIKKEMVYCGLLQ